MTNGKTNHRLKLNQLFEILAILAILPPKWGQIEANFD